MSMWAQKSKRTKCMWKRLYLESYYMKLWKCQYLLISIYDSTLTSDEILNGSDSVSAVITSTVSTDFHNKKLRYKMDCYVLHAVLLLTILLFIIAVLLSIYKIKAKAEKHLAVLAI